MAPRYQSPCTLVHTHTSTRAPGPLRSLLVVAPSVPTWPPPPPALLPAQFSTPRTATRDSLVQGAGAVLSTCCWIPVGGAWPILSLLLHETTCPQESSLWVARMPTAGLPPGPLPGGAWQKGVAAGGGALPSPAHTPCHGQTRGETAPDSVFTGIQVCRVPGSTEGPLIRLQGSLCHVATSGPKAGASGAGARAPPGSSRSGGQWSMNA